MKLLNKALTNKVLLFIITFCSLVSCFSNLEQISWWLFPPMCIGISGENALIAILAFIISFLITIFGIKRLLRQNPGGVGIGFIIAILAFFSSFAFLTVIDIVRFRI